MAVFQLVRCMVVPVIEGAVFANHGVDRPHARDVIAPACRPAGDQDDAQTGAAQSVQCGIRQWGELTVGSERVVDVAEDRVHARSDGAGQLGQRTQVHRSTRALQRQPGVFTQGVEVNLGETLLREPHVVR